MALTLPADDTDYSGSIRAIKGCFTRELVRSDAALRLYEKGEYDHGNGAFWDHTIRDDEDF